MLTAVGHGGPRPSSSVQLIWPIRFSRFSAVSRTKVLLLDPPPPPHNTTPIDNLTVAGGNFATQPSIPPWGALHTGYGACAPKAPKLITAMG
jgi:hypothetical protein